MNQTARPRIVRIGIDAKSLSVTGEIETREQAEWLIRALRVCRDMMWPTPPCVPEPAPSADDATSAGRDALAALGQDGDKTVDGA